MTMYARQSTHEASRYDVMRLHFQQEQEPQEALTTAYQFFTHFHPYVTALIRRLLEKRIAGLQAADTEQPALRAELFTSARYRPTALVTKPYPVKELDFDPAGAYSVYNLELFHHVPLLIALQYSRAQRFEEAQAWLHYIFDPTDDSDGDAPQRFWKVRPFQTTEVESIEEMLVSLAAGTGKEVAAAIDRWRRAPFRPHVVARLRPSAYMFRSVMAYLDNLIAWGDALFRQDTRESINEATQLYVMAANLLGPRPQAVPKKGSVAPQTYHSLRAKKLDELSNALVAMETDVPFDIVPQSGGVAATGPLGALASVGQTLYFCVPRNDKLLGYWDTVADRLFKIHNSLNLKGVFRQLPLFDPPLDPALLARGVAAGLDVAAVVAGVYQPLPLLRFAPLLRKAHEIAAEVRALGGALLSAIEKQDNEALAILRTKHERVILGLVETVKYQQLQEAKKSREALEKGIENTFQRYAYYERLLGRDAATLALPAVEPLDESALEKQRFQSAEPAVPSRPIAVDIASGTLSSHEQKELTLLEIAQGTQDMASSMDVLGAMMNIIPSFSVNIQPVGIGATTSFGGSNIAAIFSGMAATARAIAGRLTFEANKAAKAGSYARREQEWAMQANLAAGELTQALKQLRAAQIREAIAEREWKNHQQQMRHADEIERFFTDEKTGKRTNLGFYTWMRREVNGLYGQCFDLAVETARKAERALQHELGDPSLSFVQPGHLAGKEGLLAGEKLYLDLKRMELAYDEQNQREYELVKHVSLKQLDPRALLQLRATGRTAVALPEELFDFDGPGHFFRRLRQVSVSVPCVAGPYVSVNLSLTLRRSSIRVKPLVGPDGYERTGVEDDRFRDYFGSLQTIVTSTGQNDAGLFDAAPGERYLPFEGAGAISEWELELPHEVKQFDHDTIADVILHVRYTAREAGRDLRDAALQHLESRIDDASTMGSVVLLSIPHEFPTEWARFRAEPLDPGARRALTLDLRQEHYPFWSRGRIEEIRRLELAAPGTAAVRVFEDPVDTPPDEPVFDVLEPDDGDLGLVAGALEKVALPPPEGEFTIYLDDNTMKELWALITWGA